MRQAEDPQELAEAVRAAMYAEDNAARHLGIEVIQVAPGFARTRLALRREYANSHGIGHGGIIFALADTAFAYSCNSHNHAAVAASCAIEFIAPARVGDTLTATAREQALAGRTGVYDIEVTNQHGVRIAMFRGRSYRIKGQVVASPAGSDAVISGGERPGRRRDSA